MRRHSLSSNHACFPLSPAHLFAISYRSHDRGRGRRRCSSCPYVFSSIAISVSARQTSRKSTLGNGVSGGLASRHRDRDRGKYVRTGGAPALAATAIMRAVGNSEEMGWRQREPGMVRRRRTPKRLRPMAPCRRHSIIIGNRKRQMLCRGEGLRARAKFRTILG